MKAVFRLSEHDLVFGHEDLFALLLQLNPVRGLLIRSDLDIINTRRLWHPITLIRVPHRIIGRSFGLAYNRFDPDVAIV